MDSRFAVYNRLPIAGQTALLTLYGLRTLYRQRSWDSFLATIAASQYWPRELQHSEVAAALRRVLLHAVRTVPRYAELKSLVPALEDARRDIYELIGKFPVVTRAQVLANRKAYVSTAPGTRKITTTITSGTTGTPFRTWMSKRAKMIGDALWWRRTRWAGYKNGEWIARLVGDPVVPLTVSDPERPYRISRPDSRIYLSTFHLNPTTAATYLNILEQLQPQYLMGYPSSLEILAAFCLEQSRELRWKPKAILFSSEALYAHQEQAIRTAFRADLRGCYGSAERVVSAAQCEQGSYHLGLLDGYVEGQFGIRPSPQPALVTTLVNSVMPLIRFALGDHISFRTDAVCTCGRTLPLMDPVVTKEEDWICTPSGRRISSSVITFAFKDLNNVRQSQLVQVSANRVDLHLDTDRASFDEAARTARKRLHKMFFGEIELHCIHNNNIEVASSGKTRFVVRNI